MSSSKKIYLQRDSAKVFIRVYKLDIQSVMLVLGCALTFASEAKFEIEAKISFRLEAKKAWFHMIHFDAKHQKSDAKTKVNKRKNRSETKIKRKIDKNVFFHPKRNWEAK